MCLLLTTFTSNLNNHDHGKVADIPQSSMRVFVFSQCSFLRPHTAHSHPTPTPSSALLSSPPVPLPYCLLPPSVLCMDCCIVFLSRFVFIVLQATLYIWREQSSPVQGSVHVTNFIHGLYAVQCSAVEALSQSGTYAWWRHVVLT